MSRLPRRHPRIAVSCLAVLCGILLAACGASASSGSRGGPSAPSAAHPLTAAATSSPFLGGPSHFGGATSVGPAHAQIAWTRHLGAAIVAGPVVQGHVVYIAADNGTLRALKRPDRL